MENLGIANSNPHGMREFILLRESSQRQLNILWSLFLPLLQASPRRQVSSVGRAPRSCHSRFAHGTRSLCRGLCSLWWLCFFTRSQRRSCHRYFGSFGSFHLSSFNGHKPARPEGFTRCLLILLDHSLICLSVRLIGLVEPYKLALPHIECRNQCRVGCPIGSDDGLVCTE